MDIKDLHKYQLHAVRHILERSHCGLFLEMGLGKTVSTLTALNYLIDIGLSVRRVLVIGPKRVIESVWRQEAEKWDHLRGLKFSAVTGSSTKRKIALAKKADIYLISRDNVQWLCAYYGGSRLPFDALVIDELSSFKNHNSLRFKALRAARLGFKRIIGLTGTPAPNGLLDLWSQVFLLDGGERLGRYITKYREKYFTPGARSGHIVYKYNCNAQNVKLIQEKISDICMSMKAEDYLELPGRTVNIVRIPLDAAAQKKYDAFEREQVLKIFETQPIDEAITALNAAALANKLLQFANGAIYDSEKAWHEIHKAKIEALKEIIEDANGQPVLVAWTFRHDRDRIHEALKAYKPVDLTGDREVNAWNNGQIQVLLMHPASGGHGLNLQAGGHIIVWFGQTWSLELEQQLNARLDRQGQKSRVIIHKLVTSNTLDEDVIVAQKEKTSTQDQLMYALKARIDKFIK